MSRKPMDDRTMFTLALPGALVQRIDNYRYKNHIPSRAEAMRHMIERELERDADLEGE